MRKTLTLTLAVALLGIFAAVVVAAVGPSDDPATTAPAATTTEDRTATTTEDRTSTERETPKRRDDDDAVGDISGPCDEAEHANDPRCTEATAPTAPAEAQVRGLAGAARRVAGGDLDTRARLEGSAEQREVAAAFNEMTGRLGRALRAQQEFVANASHQLRTPLTGLRLRLEAAALKSREPDVERELAAAERETERLARLLTELLLLARERERPPAVPLELAEAAEAALERWEGPAEASGHSLRLSGDARVVVAASDEDLAVILDNLVSNALGYSPPGTTVTIEWDGGEVARLAVLDEGPGVEPGERERVFERFYRGAAGGGATAGTGLGLSVVEALARRWGGAATLDNRPEGGARAEVTLPIHRDEPALPNPEQSVDGALPERG
jgi:signal transduction histidine kinase